MHTFLALVCSSSATLVSSRASLAATSRNFCPWRLDELEGAVLFCWAFFAGFEDLDERSAGISVAKEDSEVESSKSLRLHRAEAFAQAVIR